MIRPLFLNRRLYEMDRIGQNTYLYKRLNSAKPAINTNIYNGSYEKDFPPKIKCISN
jgi:hypothetical protein